MAINENGGQPAAKIIEMVQGDLFELGTGTNGPAPRRAPKLEVVKRPPAAVSYRVALRQITATVLETLNERGEQWPSDARQDLVSTLFIAAARDKKVIFDFDPEGK